MGEDERYPDHMCKLSKALYGLQQAPRAWYECLRDFLIANAFKVGKADPTLFTKTCDGDLFVCQIYVDDIILLICLLSREYRYTHLQRLHGAFQLVNHRYSSNVLGLSRSANGCIVCNS